MTQTILSRCATVAGCLVTAFLTTAPAGLNAQQILQIDQTHSTVGFSIRFMGLTRVVGSFDDVFGTIEYDPATGRGGAVDVLIRTMSINTRLDRRDADLRSPRFFDVTSYPAMTFTADGFQLTDGVGTIAGSLTIKGRTHPVTLPATLVGEFGDSTDYEAGVEAGPIEVSREAFGVGGRQIVAPERVFLGDVVDVTLSLRLRAESAIKISLRQQYPEVRFDAAGFTGLTGDYSGGDQSVTVELVGGRPVSRTPGSFTVLTPVGANRFRVEDRGYTFVFALDGGSQTLTIDTPGEPAVVLTRQ